MPAQHLLSAETSCVPLIATKGNRRRKLTNNGGVTQQNSEFGQTDSKGGVRINIDLPYMLLRYISEVDPRKGKQAKGGYLKGQISGVPDNATKMNLYFVTESKKDSPLLLHPVRMSEEKDGTKTKGSRTLVGKNTTY